MNHDYRFVFLLGFVLTSLSAITYIFLYRGFLRQGGDTGYRAP
jgi:hypothetical protein